jgi:hypothetical protein
MTGRRGRRRKQLLDDLKEARGYWKLNEEVIDRNLCGNRFGRVYRPVVRQPAKWINEWILKMTNKKVLKVEIDQAILWSYASCILISSTASVVRHISCNVSIPRPLASFRWCGYILLHVFLFEIPLTFTNDESARHACCIRFLYCKWKAAATSRKWQYPGPIIWRRKALQSTQNYQGDLSLSTSGCRTWANAALSRRCSECDVANSTCVQV